MNIMITNMLLLENNKILKEDAGNTTVSNPVTTDAQPQAGMKALMFQGMQNLMANPKLAQGVGIMNDKMAETSSASSYVAPYSSNIAFQGSLAKSAKIALPVIAAGMALASCTEKTEIQGTPSKIEQNVTIDFKFDEIMTFMTNMQTAFASYLAQMLEQQKINNEQMQEYMAQMKIWMNSMSNDVNALKALLTNIADKVIDINNGVQENNMYQQVIISMLQDQGYTQAQAVSILQQAIDWAKQHDNNIMDALEIIMGKIDLVNENLQTINNTIQNASDKANESRTVLIALATQIVNQGNASLYQQQVMIAQNNALIQQNNVIIKNQKVIIKKIEESSLAQQATIKEVAEALGMKLDDLAAVVARTGKSIEEVMTMSKAEILEALYANNAELQGVNSNLENLDGDVKTAAQQILDALQKISDQLDALSKQFADAVKLFRGKLDKLTYYAKGCFVNGQINNAMLADLNRQMFALRGDVASIKVTAKQIRENLKNGVSVDMNQLEEFFKILNMHQTASKDEIIAKLDEFIAGQDRIEKAINKLGDENNSKLDFIANLVKNKTNDNSDVIDAINNLAKSNEDNIAAATEALAAKLDALIAKVDKVLDKMDNLAAILKQYGDNILNKLGPNGEILAAIKANGAKLDIQNMKLDELKAEVEKIKPELQKLNNNATLANTYLDIISKRQLELKDQIANLEAIGGGGITKEELEELWQKHDAEGFAKAKAYLDAIHADDIAKADEIIGYLKKGNETAKDTYTLLLNFANKTNLTTEQLKDLLQAVYDYLPNLICQCDCKGNCDDNDKTHEGIIGIIS